MKTCRLAEAHYVKVAPHDGSAGHIAEAANLQICAHIPNLIYLEHRCFDPHAPNADVTYRNEVVSGVIPDIAGHIALPTAPGLGMDINEQECQKHPYQFREAPELPVDDIFTASPRWLECGRGLY